MIKAYPSIWAGAVRSKNKIHKKSKSVTDRPTDQWVQHATKDSKLALSLPNFSLTIKMVPGGSSSPVLGCMLAKEQGRIHEPKSRAGGQEQ